MLFIYSMKNMLISGLEHSGVATLAQNVQAPPYRRVETLARVLTFILFFKLNNFYFLYSYIVLVY